MHQEVHSRARADAHAVQPIEAVLVLFVVMLLLLAVVVSSPRALGEMETATITVSSGDTIWSIAEAHPVPGMTTAEAASLLARINDLDRSTIHPGDKLQVPVKARDARSYAMR